jgi:glycosyltransferase involved in cell wall biosynthesis
MRVLHLITALNPGGIERFVLNLLEYVPRNECTMDVCCRGKEKGAWAAHAQGLGAEVLTCPLTPWHLGFAVGLRQILRRGRYDILHCHLGAYSGFPVWLGHSVGIPVINTFHNTRFEPHRWWTKLPVLRSLRSVYSKLSVGYAVKKSDLLICVSQGVSDFVHGGNEDPRRKTHVLHHGVRVPDLWNEEQKASFKESLGFRKDSILIVNVGRFNVQKNHIAIIKVFARVSETNSRARLLLVGDGELRSEIERELVSRKLEEKERLLGPHDDVYTVLTGCDVFLFPSLYEGFGIAALEANAAGLPVVGSRIPGLVDAVEDGRTAILHESGDIEGMASSVLMLLQDQQKARRMGAAGRLRVQENFSLEMMAARQLALYRKCLESRARPEGKV